MLREYYRSQGKEKPKIKRNLTFERLNINLYPGQDVTLFQNFKNVYRNKIRKYLRTVEQTDANRRKKQVRDDVMEIGDM